MIKLKSLLPENKRMPDLSLAQYLLSHKTEEFSEWLYHGSPPEGLKSILAEGLYGNQHGEIAEYDAFSTSVNSQVLELFSEMNGETGLQFRVDNIKLLILDDVMQHLAIQASGTGTEVDVDEEELERFCQQFNIPVDGRGRPYLPFGYLSSIGVDAVCYKYVWDNIQRGWHQRHQEENEICFIGAGIKKLNDSITLIYVDGNEYEPTEKAQAIQDIESRLSDD